MQKVQFIKPWKTFRSGDVIEPTGLLRDHLVAKGLAKRVDESTPLNFDGFRETATIIPSQENSALAVEPPKRRRGRPRKETLQ